jgi:hypothetical protein
VPRSSFVILFGVVVILYGSFGLLMIWTFGTMVESERLQGLDWWVEVTSKKGFLAGNLFYLGMLLLGLHLLIRSPKSWNR